MIVLKILAAPFVVVLTVLAAVVSFLFCMATAVFVVACVVLTLLAVALFIPLPRIILYPKTRLVWRMAMQNLSISTTTLRQ